MSCNSETATVQADTNPAVQLRGDERSGQRHPQPAPTPSEQQSEVSEQERTVLVSSYELSFTARANPFEPPSPDAEEQRGDVEAVASSDLRLVGLMRDGDHPMAALELYGEHRLVRAGEQLHYKAGHAALHIQEIRETEIVVEQRGRRWIVSLPRPGSALLAEQPPSRNNR